MSLTIRSQHDLDRANLEVAWGLVGHARDLDIDRLIEATAAFLRRDAAREAAERKEPAHVGAGA